MNEITENEWLKRAYELAYFIHGDKEIALEIAANAMSKLDVAANAQFKRFYYTPQGRETARAARSKVSLNDLQLLQRLVYVESESHERKKEDEKKVNSEDLLVFFIKHLVRISLKRNSFYVTLALSRILHAYGTNETMEIYNTVIQDPERVHDDYYYRSRKGKLMKEMKSRFGDLLTVAKGARGEERFQSLESVDGKTTTVKDCLEKFTPWATRCVVPEKFDPYSYEINHLSFNGRDPDEEHRVEINRIHAALHPNCYCKIVDALGFEKPDERLEIPKFAMNDDIDFSPPNDRDKPPTLSDKELQAIKELLAAQSASRHAASHGLLRVIVDGDERARLHPHEADSVAFDLDDEAELVEVRVVEKNGDVLLATHLLSFDDEEENQASIVLEGGQKISFNFNPTKNAEGETTGARFGVEYNETNLLRKIMLAWRRFLFAFSSWFNANAVWKPALAFGLVLIACAVGLWFYLQGQNPVSEVAKNISIPTPKIENIPTPEPQPSPSTTAKDNQQPKPTVPQKKQTAPAPQKKTEPNYEQVAIARTPIRGDTRIDEQRNETLPDLKLNQIKKIYVQVSGDDVLSKQTRDEITKALSSSGRFTVVSNEEQAEGHLKVSVKRNPTKSDRTEIEVRMVNPRGRYVWTNRKNVVGWKYVGEISQLPSRIVKDLVKDSRQ
jgi:hypothetical protein